MKRTKEFQLGLRADFLLSMKGDLLTDYFVGVVGDRIKVVEPWNHQDRHSQTFIYRPNQALLPGLVNGHTHLAMTLFRGLADDAPFKKWLFSYILPLEQKVVTPEFVKVGTELGVLESIRFGVTTVNDMYFFPQTVAEVFDQAGIRGIIHCPVQDHPSPDDPKGVKRNLNVARTLHTNYANHPRIRIGLGPHAPYSCSDELLTETQKISEELDLSIHIHVNESKNERQDSIDQYGVSPLERLDRLGLLHSKTSCAHAVHLTDREMRQLAERGTSVIHNPESNMKLGSGIAPVPEMTRLGVTVGLGTDGAASNNNLSILSEMGSAARLQKLLNPNQDAFVARHTVEMATLGGAAALGLQKEIGSIEVGKKADLILIDLGLPHMQPMYDLMSQLVFAADGMEVSTTICDGKILMNQHQFTSLDPLKIYAKANEFRDQIRKSLNENKEER